MGEVPRRDQWCPAGKLREAARALYEPEASEEELDAFGFKPSDFADDVAHVWPQNWRAVQLFSECATQWRASAGGATGLDYVAVLAVMKLHGYNKKQQKKLLADIGVMEAEALEVMSERNGKRKGSD